MDRADRPDGRLDWEPVAGDVVAMRRAHVCGDARMVVVAVGLDIRLRCLGCGAKLILERGRLRARARRVLGTAAEVAAGERIDPSGA